ncbi:hypothetical protein MNBD_NITROSPINAE04-1112 [hydrothermal vent metagenome]|uniref:Peptidase M48 domain-containing protein n=1 Tax=hydrothermal vent metagenome TaxID=652676 RepID=A0A3B1CJD8_9ZZZZ
MTYRPSILFTVTPVLASLVILFSVTVSADSSVTPSGPLSKRDYWISQKKLLDKNDARSTLAHKIFADVLAAADRRPGPIPELFILDEEGYPWARSLPDGTIILTRGAIDICLKAKSSDNAKARLAFIIGHELSHQVNGDFWHFFFYQGVRPELAKDPDMKKTLEQVMEIALLTDQVITKELKADQYGVIYASQAGYNVRRIVDTDVNFFREWTAATSPALLKGAMLDVNHPQIEQRSATVLITLKKVSEKVKVFDKGVEAYKRGGYVFAKSYFEDFLSVYQSREAYNNLGLVYYQMAADQLDKWKPDRPAFRLSLIIDADTRAKKTLSFRKQAQSSLARTMMKSESHESRFIKYANTASKYFREAAERDHTYSPAHNNLACVHFLKSEYSSAVGELDLSLTLNPENAEAYNNRGVAYLQMGRKIKVNLNEKVEADLEKAIELKPDYVDAIFNIAYFYKLNDKVKKKNLYAKRLAELDPGSRLLRALR